MMKRIILLSILLGVAGFFGTLGFLYGINTMPEPAVVEEVTDNWVPYTPKPKKVDGPSELYIVHTNDVLDFKEVDRFCLAKNIYHEARSEDLLGQLAVAQVTLNRVESPNYPNDICGVVMQPWQFSWANDRSIRWTHPKHRLWEASKALANQFLDNGVRVRGLETALFYHADYVDPSWRDDEYFVAQVGAHLFYENAKNL